jgi:hypothetical protein
MKHTIGLSTQPRCSVEVETLKVQGTWRVAMSMHFGPDNDVVLLTPEQASVMIFAMETALEELETKAINEQVVEPV